MTNISLSIVQASLHLLSHSQDRLIYWPGVRKRLASGVVV